MANYKIVCFALFLIGLFTACSNEPDDTFSHVHELVFSGAFKEAIPVLDSIRTHHAEGSYKHFYASYQLGEIYYQLNEYEKAAAYFIPLNGYKYSKYHPRNFVKLTWIDDPYSHSQGMASQRLAQIALLEKDYSKAKRYIEQFGNQIDDLYGCGTMMLSLYGDLNQLHRDYYFGMGDLHNAIYCIGSELFKFDQDDEVLISLIDLIQQKVEPSAIDLAKEELLKIHIYNHEQGTMYSTRLFDIRIDIADEFSWYYLIDPENDLDNLNEQKTSDEIIEICRNHIRGSAFFNQL